jgi:YVTN family beta-propeller protein
MGRVISRWLFLRVVSPPNDSHSRGDDFLHGVTSLPGYDASFPLLHVATGRIFDPVFSLPVVPFLNPGNFPYLNMRRLSLRRDVAGHLTALLQNTGRLILLTCSFCSLLLLSACSEDTVGPSALIIPGPNEPIVYSKHIEPIFYRSCGGEGCHLNEGHAGKVAHDAGGDLELDTWGSVMSGSEHGAVVVPYWSSKSHLLFHINSDTTLAPVALPHMPTENDTLPREQILLIKRWIDEGAKNDNGEVAMAGETLPRIFVTAQAEDKVTAIDLQRQLVMRYITVGQRPDSTTPPEAPHNITLSPDGRFLYVNLIAAGLVEKYDARTFQKLGQVQVGVSPAQIVVTGDGSTLYVSNFDISKEQRFVNRVDAASMQVTGVIDEVGLAPHGLTLSRDEHYLYTMNASGDDIAEIDLTKPVPEVTRRIPIVPGSALPPGQQAIHEPYQSVLSSDGMMLFVTCRKSGQVRVVDLAQGKVVDSITVGARPLILNITPDGKEIWVPNQASDNVSIIDVATRAVVATIPNIGKQPHGVAFKSNGTVAYISCENQTGEAHHPTTGSRIPGLVYPVVVATRFVGEPIEVGSFAAGIVVGK